MDILTLVFLYAVIQVPSVCLTLFPLYNCLSKRKRRWLYGFCLLFWGMNACICFLYALPANAIFFKLDIFLFNFIVLGISLLFNPKRWRVQLFVYGLNCIMVTTLLSISSCVVQLFDWKDLSHLAVKVGLLYLALFGIVYIPICKLLNYTVTPFLQQEDSSYWKSVWPISITMFLAAMICTPLDFYQQTIWNLVSRLFLCLATLFICEKIAYDRHFAEERQQMHLQLQMQKRYYDALAQNVLEQRRARHDFKHHLAAMKGLLDAGDMQGLHQYFSQFERNAGEQEIPSTGCLAADGVLFHYGSLAREQGIKFTVSCSFRRIPLSEMELCSLLGNALDNALTACLKSEEMPFLSVSSRIQEGCLLITVDNSFDGVLYQKGNVFYSRKRESQPGVGIPTMQEICRRHHGICRFDAHEKQFEVSFLLPFETES